MKKNKLEELAWNNFCSLEEKRKIVNKKRGEFISSVSIGDDKLGEPYPLSLRDSVIPAEASEIRNGWEIPDRYAIIGIYLGKQLVYKGNKKRMTFAAPTKGDTYRIYVSGSGEVDFFEGGEDEPYKVSGISVEGVAETDAENTKAINKKFGDKVKYLESLVKKRK